MRALTATVQGVGFWTNDLHSWPAACAHVANPSVLDPSLAKPSPQLLAANERRRAPDSVAVALEVALAACRAASVDPKSMPSVFASTHGDLAITDYMCATLAQDPRALSPTKFHNSVHNAAAGYWAIGTGCTLATTAISAYRATFAHGLLEALLQLADGAEAVLLVAYDTAAVGPLSQVSASQGLLGGAIVLSRATQGSKLNAVLTDGIIKLDQSPLGQRLRANAMAPMLPLFDALALKRPTTSLDAGPDRMLHVELSHD